MTDAARLASPFQPIELSSDEQATLRHAVDRLVQDACEEYDLCLSARCRDDGHPSRLRWKAVKQEHNLRVYRERRQRHRASTLSSASAARAFLSASSSSVSSSSSSFSAASKPPFRFLALGSLAGKVEDAVYGCMCLNSDQVRLRGAYREDPLLGATLLSALQRPTPNDPLRSLAVTWMSMRLPLGLHRVAKNPDAILLDATGMTRLPTGEQVGFNVVHSIELPQLPPLAEFTRVHISLITLFRQTDDGRLDIFLQASVALRLRQVLGKLIARRLCRTIAGGGVMANIAAMKKLTWVLRQERAHPAPLARSNSSFRSPGICGSCDESMQSLFKGCAMCAICGVCICTKCAHRVKLFAVASDQRVFQFERTCCGLCMGRVRAMDPALIAVDEARAIAAQAERAFRASRSISNTEDARVVKLSDHMAHFQMTEDWARLSWRSQESDESITDSTPRHSDIGESGSSEGLSASQCMDIEQLD